MKINLFLGNSEQFPLTLQFHQKIILPTRVPFYSNHAAFSKKIFCCLMIILLPFLNKAQTPHSSRDISSFPSINIGNIVPDLFLHQLINYKDTCVSLSDFNGKLIILDFWSIYCKTCIKALPKLDSLQKEFAGKIQILLITHPSGKNFGIASMKETFARWDKAGLYTPRLPVATSGNDNIIALFPHEYIPHYVWIDSRGRLCAVTSYQLMNKQTIQTLLNNH